MAVPCPACAHLHFETNRAEVPSHCAACGHDLAEPVAPPAPVPDRPPPPAASRPLLCAAIAVLCVAGWLVLSGVAERGKYRPVTATITAGYLEGTSAGNSYYLVDGQTYRTAIDRRWRLADRFEMWYYPDAPEGATEVRPFGRFLAAGFLVVVGLFLVGLSVGIFGAAAEPVDERVALAEPTAEEAAAVHSPPSFAADDVRRRGG